MKKEIYARLLERLNQYEGKLFPVDATYEMLEKMYTEEEAIVASKFPDGLHTVTELAPIIGKDEASLTKIMETMADKGTLFFWRSETGERKYDMMPYVPGAIEYYLIRKLDSPEAIKEVGALNEKMTEQGGTLFLETMAEDPAKAVAMIPSAPLFRAVTVNEALPDGATIYSHENALEMVDTATSFAVMSCICRDMAPHLAGPCHVEGAPKYSCLTFGKTADFLVERKTAKRITKEECRDILRECNKLGLVHNSNNFVDELQFICNCCPDCCGVLTQAKKMGPQQVMISAANFASVVDERSCNGCGSCADICPMGALILKDDVAVVDRALCIGCGNCVPVCPTKSVSMVRTAETRLELGNRKVGFGFTGLSAT